MDLFDIIAVSEDQDKAECPHSIELLTSTVWPGESCLRMTYTCANPQCKNIRGRMGNFPPQRAVPERKYYRAR